MILATTVIYFISSILVLIAVCQRTKNEELFSESDSFLLPIITVISFILLYLVLVFVDHKTVNGILMVLFVCTGYYSIIMNMYYLYEFTEYEIEERVLQETIISSEFSELLLESHVHQSHNHLNQSQLNNDQTQLNNNQSRIHSLNASQANNSQLHNQNRTHHSNHSRQYRHRLKRALKRLIRYLKRTIFEMRPVDAVIYFVGLTFVTAYYITRDWLIGDIITGSICFQSIRELKLDSIITGYIHLSILVCYDILMLIYHDYVDTLMHDITVPIRLVFPQNFKGYDLVGIGDIFIPALFLAIVKRYSDKYDVRAVFVYTYIGFCVGVFVAWLPVVILKHHMPVLLFLCPVLACFSLLAAYFCADFWHYIYFKRSSAK